MDNYIKNNTIINMENSPIHKIYISTDYNQGSDIFEKKKNDDLYDYKYDEESTTYIPVSPKRKRRLLTNEYLPTFIIVLLFLLILPLAFHKIYYSHAQSAEKTEFVDCQKALLFQNNNHSPFDNQPSILDKKNNKKDILNMFDDLDTMRNYELRNKVIKRRMVL